MGRFVYEDAVRAEFEDRLLLHLQIVIGTKLRRSEPFFFSWKEDVSVGSGRTTVWIHPCAALVFTFHGSRTPAVSREWLDELMRSANSLGGLQIVPEPAPGAASDGATPES